MVVNAKNTSEVSNNTVSGNSVTGTISFDDSAFASMNGLSVLSANTGNKRRDQLVAERERGDPTVSG